MSTLIIEYLDSIGHKKINTLLIKELQKKLISVDFITTKNYDLEIEPIKRKEFFSLPYYRQSKLIYHLNIISILIQMVLYYQFKYKNFIFLSFENRWFPIFSWLMISSTSAMIHNNIDLSKKQYFSNLKIINPKITLEAFEQYITDNLVRFYHAKSKTIKHPIINVKCIKKNLKTILAPGNNNNYSEKDEQKIIQYLEISDSKLLTRKSFRYKNSLRITQIGYIENLEDELKKVSWVLINCNYEYRVSGIFYEAIGAGCKILYADDSKFLNEMRLKYFDRVFHIDDLLNEDSNCSKRGTYKA